MEGNYHKQCIYMKQTNHGWGVFTKLPINKGDLIEKAILNSQNEIKAIMPVDLFGLPARYRMINEIAKKYNIPVIGGYSAAGGWKDETRSVNSDNMVTAEHTNENADDSVQ